MGGRRQKSGKFPTLSSLHRQTSAKLRPMSGESKILHSPLLVSPRLALAFVNKQFIKLISVTRLGYAIGFPPGLRCSRNLRKEGQKLVLGESSPRILWVLLERILFISGSSRKHPGTKEVLSECSLNELMGFIIKIKKGSRSRELLLLNLATLAEAVGIAGRFGKRQEMWIESVI